MLSVGGSPFWAWVFLGSTNGGCEQLGKLSDPFMRAARRGCLLPVGLECLTCKYRPLAALESRESTGACAKEVQSSRIAVFAAHFITACISSRIGAKERCPLHKWRPLQPLTLLQNAHACRIALLCSRCGPGMTSRTTSLRACRPRTSPNSRSSPKRSARRNRWCYLQRPGASVSALWPRQTLLARCVPHPPSASGRRGPKASGAGGWTPERDTRRHNSKRPSLDRRRTMCRTCAWFVAPHPAIRTIIMEVFIACSAQALPPGVSSRGAFTLACAFQTALQGLMQAWWGT